MRVLGVETSCDECSVAVVEEGRRIMSMETLTQTAIHARFSGVVPEVASRAHAEMILPVASAALERSGCSLDDIDLVAVTNRPGLSGSLTVGLAFAKALALSRSIPFVAVDHIVAHAYAIQLDGASPVPVGYPYITLLVSGGHTVIAVSRDVETLEVLGGTIDDACGEAFDKVASFLDLEYPGGPAIERLATGGDAEAFAFPTARLGRRARPYDVSFSGLKTAVIHQRERFRRPGAADSAANVAASFQKSAIDVLVDRVDAAVRSTGITTVAAGGGVAANGYLRERLMSLPAVASILPPGELCVDNGAMVAGLGYHMYTRNGPSSADAGVRARVPLFRSS